MPRSAGSAAPLSSLLLKNHGNSSPPPVAMLSPPHHPSRLPPRATHRRHLHSSAAICLLLHSLLDPSPPWLPVSHPKHGHRQPATGNRQPATGNQRAWGGGGSTPELKCVSTLGDEPQAHASSCVGGLGKWKSGACIRKDAACSTRDACAPSRLSPANRSRPFEAAVNA